MKHKNTLETHLHRIQQLQQELSQRKAVVLEELQRLTLLHSEIQPKVTTQTREKPDLQQSPENRNDTDKNDNGDILNQASQVFEQARDQLKDLARFLEASNAELSEIKNTFENEYPLVGTRDEDLEVSEEILQKKDQAVCRMTESLETLRHTVNQKLDADYVQKDVEDLLSKLDIPGRGRSRPKTRLSVISQSGGVVASGQRRSSSLSKERLLSKAKQVRAAKEAHPLNTHGSSIQTSTSGQSFSDRENVENIDPTKTQDKEKSISSIADKQDDCVSGPDSKEPKTEVIQVQEVTSSVQENIRGRLHNSFGESLTESSIMTSSTVSALLGDSSLQSAMSSDNSDVKEATGSSDSSLDSMTPSAAGEEVSLEDQNSSSELVVKHHEALLLSRPKLKGSRYIQVGLPEPQAAWEGGDFYLPNPNTAPSYRPFYSPYPSRTRPSPGLYLPGSPQRHPYRRSQSSHPAYRHPWYSLPQGYYSPPRSSRRSQSSYPVYRQDQPGGGHLREADLQGGLVRLEATCPSAVPSSGQEVASWPREHAREGVNGRRNGVSSVGSSASSESPTPENGSEGRSDEDPQDEVDGCPLEPKSGEKGQVTVKLVTSEHVQKHRGPGLLDHRTPVDCFKYPREKSLEELADFVHKRLKQNSRGRLRLWLFEEDEEGMFLPRKMLKGHFTKRSVGSLNQATVTLYVQMAEQRERLHTFDHHKVRFVFVKTPHWDTGEFVVKGHHHVDINKATRAVIQILKKKFMPQCPSSLRLYIETGGKKMYCVPHNAASTFDQDTGGRSRQGDILVLLEDFIGQQTSALGQPSLLPKPELVPLAPVYQRPSSKDSEGAASGSGGESSMASDDQEEGSPVRGSSDSPASAQDNGYHPPHSGGGTERDDQGSEDLEPKHASPADTSQSEVNFIIRFDSTSSTSDESPISPGSETNLSHHNLSHHNSHSADGGAPHNNSSVSKRQQLLQWNLTNNYMTRFNPLPKDRGPDSAQPADAAQRRGNRPGKEMDVHEDDDDDIAVPESRVQAVEYDSLEVSSGRIEMTSVEYESLMVSGSLGEELLGRQDSGGAGLLAPEGNRAAAIHTTKVTEVHSSLQLTTDSPLRPSAAAAAVMVAAAEEECTRVSVTSTEISDSQNQVLVTTIDVSEKQELEDEDKAANHAGDLNPVAPVFTPRTRIRIQQLGKRFDYHNNPGPKNLGGGLPDLKAGNGGRGRSADEKFRHGRKEGLSVTLSPNTPHTALHGNSVFLSDEDLSVYYTPCPAFLYPDSRPRLQSTAIPLADMNNSDSQSQLHPDQISAITNRSSSFMAVRVPRPPSLGVEQISAIPNISTSFMEIPSQIQLHNTSSLPGHSPSLSQRHGSGSSPHDPSFVASASPRRGFHKSFETSHLQASHSAALPPCAMKPSSRRSSHRRGSNRTAGRQGEAPSPASLRRVPLSPAAARERRRSRDRAGSEASAVKQEDPAIMDIGKQVLAKAQKSSLNANAIEFIPKELPPPTPPLPQQEYKQRAGLQLLKAGENTSHFPPPPPFQRHHNAPHMGLKYFRNAAMTTTTPGSGRGGYPPHRSSVLSRPPAYPPAASSVSKITSSNLYSALKHQSGALTAFGPKPPILMSLTDGSPVPLPPKPRPDTSRHVTFADPPIRSVKMTSRFPEASASNNAFSPRYREYAHAPAPHVKPAHPNHGGDLHGPSFKQDSVMGRRKIGSGRFDDRPKRYVGEYRKTAQKTPSLLHTQACDPPPSSTYRKYPPAYPKASPHYSNGPAENGVYTSRRYGPAYPEPSAIPNRNFNKRRDDMRMYGNADFLPPPPPPPPPRHRMDNYRNEYPHTYRVSSRGSNIPPHHTNGHFLPEDRGYPNGQPFAAEPRPLLDPYKQPRSSYRPSHATTVFRSGQRRTQPREGFGKAHPGMDFRFRRPIRAHPPSNTSSDQSDCSVQNGRAGGLRFRRVGRPHPDSETETSLGSVTFPSEESHVTDSLGERSADALASTGSSGQAGSGGESSDNRTSQSSGSSRQSTRLRRGYIQLGLGAGVPPVTIRSE